MSFNDFNLSVCKLLTSTGWMDGWIALIKPDTYQEQSYRTRWTRISFLTRQALGTRRPSFSGSSPHSLNTSLSRDSRITLKHLITGIKKLAQKLDYVYFRHYFEVNLSNNAYMHGIHHCGYCVLAWSLSGCITCLPCK